MVAWGAFFVRRVGAAFVTGNASSSDSLDESSVTRVCSVTHLERDVRFSIRILTQGGFPGGKAVVQDFLVG